MRISYLHHLLTRSENELISKVYFAQKRKPVKDDWVLTVENDMNEIGLNCSEEEIKSMSKVKFKSLVKDKIAKEAFNYLQNLQSSHSKVKHIGYEKLEMQNYIKSDLLTTDEKQLLFALRTATINVRANFRGAHPNTNCNLCLQNVPQTSSYLLDCAAILTESDKIMNNDRVQLEHVFGDVEHQREAAQIFKEALSIKSKIENETTSTNDYNFNFVF